MYSTYMDRRGTEIARSCLRSTPPPPWSTVVSTKYEEKTMRHSNFELRFHVRRLGQGDTHRLVGVKYSKVIITEQGRRTPGTSIK